MGLGNKEIVNGIDVDGQNLTSLGKISQAGTDTSYTPGSAIANTPGGIAAIGIGATTCTISNYLCTATSLVDINWLSDHGSTRHWVTRVNGAFTVNLASPATANTSFTWVISDIANPLLQGLRHYWGMNDNSNDVYTSGNGTDTTMTYTGFRRCNSLATARYNHTATLLSNGKVLVAGGIGSVALATCEIYDPATGLWTATGSFTTGARYLHTATLLSNGKVLVAGGYNSVALATCEIFDPAGNGGVGSWTATGAGTLNTSRSGHTATLLPGDIVLITGGNTGLTTCEIYTAGTWTYTTGPMAIARYRHTATLLQNGKVLVAGGFNYINTCELYDPSTGLWTSTGSMSYGRHYHTATLLPDNKVLVTAGATNTTCELYDQTTGLWNVSGIMGVLRSQHVATLLNNGTVLITGSVGLASCEIYNCSTDFWVNTANPMGSIRYSHTATLLTSGKVLIAGGAAGGVATPTCEIYEVPNIWSPTESLPAGRLNYAATKLPDGKVLVSGGSNGTTTIRTCEIYDPDTGLWTATGRMNIPRYYHAATLLANGKVLVIGGQDSITPNTTTKSCEIFDPAGNGGVGSWTMTGSMDVFRSYPVSILLVAPANDAGKVLVVGGQFSVYEPTCEIFDPAGNGGIGSWSYTGNITVRRIHMSATLLSTGQVLVVGGYPGITNVDLYTPTGIGGGNNTWISVNSMAYTRYAHTTTLLGDNTVLAAGGANYSTTCEVYTPSSTLDPPTAGTWTTKPTLPLGTYAPSISTPLISGNALIVGGTGATGVCQIYDYLTSTWLATVPLVNARNNHMPVLLNGGKVLIAGGSYTPQTAELYDPGTNTCTATGSMDYVYLGYGINAVILPSGKVLTTGGTDPTCRLYDPATGLWTKTGSLTLGERRDHTTTLLNTGKVLLVGGRNVFGTQYASCELYDPATGTWTPTGSISLARILHKAVTLQNNKVLICGGFDLVAVCQLYNPTTGLWENTGGMIQGRYAHTATILQNGKVLVTGGFTPNAPCEIFDPAGNGGVGSWSRTGNIGFSRIYSTINLLNNGTILVTGGYPPTGVYPYISEIYNPTTASWSPTDREDLPIRYHTTTLLPSGKVLLAGSQSITNCSRLYNPATGLWELNKNLYTGNYLHTATLLQDGSVLLAGGVYPTCQVYVPGLTDSPNGYASFNRTTNSNINTNVMGPTEAQSWSVSMWVNLGSTTGYETILSWGLTVGYSVNVIKWNNVSTIYIGDGTNWPLGTTCDINTWNHLVFIYNGTTITTYKNGTLVAGPTALALNVLPGPIRMGRSAYVAGDWFSGFLDEVAIFDRALTATEVTELYNSSLGKLFPF